MKQMILALLIVLCPAPAKATLVFYDISFTVLAENLFQPLYGGMDVVVRIAQDSQGDPVNQHIRDGAFFSVDLVGDDVYPRGGLVQLSVVSPMEIGFFIGDPAGNVWLNLFYDTPLGPFPFASLLPHPDALAFHGGSELRAPDYFACNQFPTFPCPLGTGGEQTFARGEFNFTAVPESPAWLLFGFGLIIVGFQRRLS